MARVGTTRFAERMGVSRKAVHKAMAAQRITSWGKDDEGRIWIDEDLAAVEWARNTDPVEAAKNGKFWSIPEVPVSVTDHAQVAAAEAGEAAKAQAIEDASVRMVAGFFQEKHPTTAATLTGLGADGPVAGGSVAPDAASPAASGGQPAGETDYQRARTEREEANARLAQIELQKQLGVLCEVAVVQKAAFAVARVVRDAFMLLPDRLAQRLAMETDPGRVHADLETEIRFCLNGLADRLPAAVAEGPG